MFPLLPLIIVLGVALNVAVGGGQAHGSGSAVSTPIVRPNSWSQLFGTNSRTEGVAYAPLRDSTWWASATPSRLQAMLDRWTEVLGTTSAVRDELRERDKEGWTPLHWAAAWSIDPAVVEVLLDWGADPTLRTKAGQLPADLAAENAHLKDTPVYWRLHEAQF